MSKRENSAAFARPQVIIPRTTPDLWDIFSFLTLNSFNLIINCNIKYSLVPLYHYFVLRICNFEILLTITKGGNKIKMEVTILVT